jgi:hypothetical protein
MTSLAMSVVGYFQERREATWRTLVRVVFGLFISSLVTVLALSYAGVPLV